MLQINSILHKYWGPTTRPFTIKALYRRCQAYLKTSDLVKAETDIKRALIIDPNNRYQAPSIAFSFSIQFNCCSWQASINIFLLTRLIYFLFLQWMIICSLGLIIIRDIKLEYKELKLKQKEYSRHEADIFSTMLSRMN